MICSSVVTEYGKATTQVNTPHVPTINNAVNSIRTLSGRTSKDLGCDALELSIRSDRMPCFETSEGVQHVCHRIFGGLFTFGSSPLASPSSVIFRTMGVPISHLRRCVVLCGTSAGDTTCALGADCSDTTGAWLRRRFGPVLLAPLMALLLLAPCK